MNRKHYKHTDDIREVVGATVKAKNKKIIQEIARSKGISVGKFAGLIIEDKINQLQKEGKLEDIQALDLRELFDLINLI